MRQAAWRQVMISVMAGPAPLACLNFSTMYLAKGLGGASFYVIFAKDNAQFLQRPPELMLFGYVHSW